MKMKNTITLSTAMELIEATLENCKHCPKFSPYFFIVGAGISMPEIMGSLDIAKSCREIVKKRYVNMNDRFMELDHDGNAVKSNPMKFYSYWLEKAYPNKADRSLFYKDMIKRAKISEGNLLLAQIIASKKLATTVFTPNFDDKLKTALDLIGEFDIFVADNPLDNLALDTISTDIQIAHVHGTYRFYDCANLESEIGSVSTQSGLTSAARALESHLSFMAPIIVGYSGWEEDLIMSCLKRRIQYAIPYKYIWVCFSEQDYYDLPLWLKECQDVLYVVPEHFFLQNDEKATRDEAFINRTNSTEKNLSAVTFLSSLITKLSIQPPKILSNPYIHYSEMFKSILPENEDVLLLRRWVERMRLWGENASYVDKAIQPIELAALKKNYKDVANGINCILEIDSIDTSDCVYVYKNIISNIIQHSEIIDNFDDRLFFHKVVIHFLGIYKEKLKLHIDLNDEYSNCIFITCKGSEVKQISPLVEDIINDTKCDPGLKETYLCSLGVKSSLTDCTEQKMSLLDKIINESSGFETTKGVSYCLCQAYIRKSKLVDQMDISSKLLSKASEIALLTNNNRLLADLYNVQSELALEYINQLSSKDWIMDSLKSVLLIDSGSYAKKKLRICINFIEYCKNSNVIEIVEQIDAISKTLDECNGMNHDRESMLLYTIIVTYFILIMHDDAITKKYSEIIINHMDKIHDNEDSISQLLEILSCVANCPTSIISDKSKCHYILQIKEHVKTEDQYLSYLRSLNTSIIIGERHIFEENGFTDDIEKAVSLDKLDNGVSEYINGNHIYAETAFSGLVNCEYKCIQDRAKINLSYMIRRCEVVNKYPAFIDQICNVDDKYSTKNMNIILYCLKTKECKIECTKAILNLKYSDAKEYMNSYNWWLNDDIVGKEESEIAITILDALRTSPNSNIKDIIFDIEQKGIDLSFLSSFIS